jgi:hypothetical protein
MARSTRAQGATLRIEIRITEEEKAIIKGQANSASLTMSEYIRRTAMNRANPFDDGPEGRRRTCKTRWTPKASAHADQRSPG